MLNADKQELEKEHHTKHEEIQKFFKKHFGDKDPETLTREELEEMGLAVLAPREMAFPAVTTIPIPETVSSQEVGHHLSDSGFLVIRGAAGSGKTTVVRTLMGASSIDTIEPTLGFTIQTLPHNATGTTLHVWDVGGQRSLRAYWRNYFEATDGLVWVVDSTDTRRLDDCRQALAELLHEERLAAATLLILCNKQDQPNALTPQQIAQRLDLERLLALSPRRHYQIQACSAVTGEGVTLDWLVQDIVDRIYFLSK